MSNPDCFHDSWTVCDMLCDSNIHLCTFDKSVKSDGVSGGGGGGGSGGGGGGGGSGSSKEVIQIDSSFVGRIIGTVFCMCLNFIYTQTLKCLKEHYCNNTKHLQGQLTKQLWLI